MNGESGDVVERSKSLETQNENLKQTVYRLSLELRSQKQVYEDEIEYLRANVNNQDKEIAELEKVKEELQAKVGALSSQIAVCNDEIVSKSKEIEKLRTIIKGNEMFVSKDSQPVAMIPSMRTQTHNQSQFPRKNPISLRTSKGIVGVMNEVQQQQQQQKNENDFDLITTNLKNLTLTLSAQINKQNEHLEKNSIVMDSLKNAVNEFKNKSINNYNQNHNQNPDTYSSRFSSVSPSAGPGAKLIVGDAITSQHLSGDNPHHHLNKYLIQSHGSGWKLNSHHTVQRRETQLLQQQPADADMGIQNGKDQDPWGIQEISDLGLGSHSHSHSHSFLTGADKDTLTDTEMEMEISKLKENLDAITSENLDLKEKLGQLNEQTTAICEEINILRTNQNDLLQMWFS